MTLNLQAIPPTWRWATLGETCQFRSGSTLPEGEAFQEQDGGWLLLKVADLNIDNNSVAIRSAREWTGITPRGAVTCPVNAVILPKRGGAIATNKKRLLLRQAALDPNLMGVIPNNDLLEPNYLFIWFRQFDLATITNGSTVPQLNIKDLAPLRLPLPPLPEQRRIAAILDKADAIRRKREEGIRLTEELLRSTFLEMFGDPAMNPKGWERVQLSNILRVGLRNGISPATNGTVAGRVLVLSAITGRSFDPQQVKDGRFMAVCEPEQMVNLDDFLICRGNGNRTLVGAGRFPTVSIPGTVFPDTMIAAGVDFARINRLFFEHLWATRCVRQQIEAGARTTNGTYKVNQQVLSGIEFPLPPLAEQERYARFATKLSIPTRQEALQVSESLFDSLVQLAFRGGI